MEFIEVVLVDPSRAAWMATAEHVCEALSGIDFLLRRDDSDFDKEKLVKAGNLLLSTLDEIHDLPPIVADKEVMEKEKEFKEMIETLRALFDEHR